MDSFERDVLLKSLKTLIEKRTIGTVDEIAEKVGIHRRTLFRLIHLIEAREQVEIKYSKKDMCYQFIKDEK